jgi:hypothetical protein
MNSASNLYWEIFVVSHEEQKCEIQICGKLVQDKWRHEKLGSILRQMSSALISVSVLCHAVFLHSS